MSGVLLEILDHKAVLPPPIWLMRQAGRYLPEYRQLRAKAGSFLNLCTTPTLAAQATLQPVRRFRFDAAIVFSDILVVAAALGVPVTFDEGPKLGAFKSVDSLEFDPVKRFQALRPVYDALGLARRELPERLGLIGFAGGPWTLATYMAAGDGEQKAAKLWSYRDPAGFQRLIDLLVDCVSQHLVEQLKAGADVVQLFDSWAAVLTASGFERWVVEPTTRIVAAVRAAVPGARIIGFPRGASLEGYELYARSTGVDVVSLDTIVPIGWAVGALGKHVVLQGNLDPVALLAGGQALTEAVGVILEATRGTPFIFNLGHGVLPETPVEHVAELVRLVRGGQ